VGDSKYEATEGERSPGWQEEWGPKPWWILDPEPRWLRLGEARAQEADVTAFSEGFPLSGEGAAWWRRRIRTEDAVEAAACGFAVTELSNLRQPHPYTWRKKIR
jgi:hypothetical protein